MVAGVQARALEPEIRRVGAELAAAFPSPARHPLRALDEKAMEYSARDEALRAALFRFVDVVPACRSLDDLAVHLTGYLDELPSRTPPLEGAMRMAHTRAGRAALGAAACCGAPQSATPTSTSSWSPWTPATPSLTSCSPCSTSPSWTPDPRPGSCCRRTCATRPRSSSGSSSGPGALPARVRS